MKVIIYGANLSGLLAYKLVEFQKNKTLCFVDRNVLNKHEGIPEQLPVYPNVNSVPSEYKNKVNKIIVAMGNETAASKVKQKLEEYYSSFKVITVHEEPYVDLYKALLNERVKNKYLEQSGFYKSVELKQSVDKDGTPIPWISYPLFDLVKDRIKKEFNVFEWGSGNSTIWWEKNVRKVVAVEHDENWYKYVVKKTNPKNTKVIHSELEYDGNYSKAIFEYKEIDIVVIDGRDRVNCAKNSVNQLSRDGVIIWDDTERTYYQEGFDYLKSKGFKSITFSGIKGISSNPSYSSIFYRENNCLGI